MQILTRQAVRGAKTVNARPQRALLALQSFGVGFAGSQLGEEPRDQRRHRGVPFGGFYARPAIGLIVHSNSDILHIVTLSQEASQVETAVLDAMLWASAACRRAAHAEKRFSGAVEAVWPARSPLRYDEGLCRHIIIPRLHLTAAAPILAGLCAFGLMVDQNRFILLSLGLQIAALIACDELPDGRSEPFFWFRSLTCLPRSRR